MMKRFAIVAGVVLAAGLAHAQPASSPPSGPAPTGLVVGSGNFFSPIVANLDAAVAFYRDGIGFAIDGEPSNADANAALKQMFGLPDARLRWQIGRAPPLQGGVEIVEISAAGGERLGRSVQQPGAVMLVVVVREIDATLSRLKQLGAPVATRGGEPIAVGDREKARAVVVQDPGGHFVELLQPATLDPALPPSNVVGVRVRHAVANLDRALALYRDALGLGGVGTVSAGYESDAADVELFGLPENATWRSAALRVPSSGLDIELIEYKDAPRPARPARLADPGATRMQLRVADIGAAVAALTRAGGTFVSTGGRPLDLPAGNGTLKVGIVRDPDDLFLVLIESPAPPR